MFAKGPASEIEQLEDGLCGHWRPEDAVTGDDLRQVVPAVVVMLIDVAVVAGQVAAAVHLGIELAGRRGTSAQINELLGHRLRQEASTADDGVQDPPNLSNSPFRTPPINACHSSGINARTRAVSAAAVPNPDAVGG